MKQPDSRRLLVAGALLGATGVMAGAFGAHGLRESLSARALEIWHIGADYQLWHALACLGAGLLQHLWPCRSYRIAGWAFVAGTLVFSGSLYLLAATGVTTFGAIAPIGGTTLIVGWLCLVWGGLRHNLD